MVLGATSRAGGAVDRFGGIGNPQRAHPGFGPRLIAIGDPNHEPQLRTVGVEQVPGFVPKVRVSIDVHA